MVAYQRGHRLCGEAQNQRTVKACVCWGGTEVCVVATGHLLGGKCNVPAIG